LLSYEVIKSPERDAVPGVGLVV